MMELLEFLFTLRLEWYLDLIMSIFCLIVARILYRLYRRTGVTDYLIFGGSFFCFAMYLFPTRIAIFTNFLIPWQLWQSSLLTSAILLFIHALRVYWDRYPRILGFFGISLYLILELLILFWQPMPAERATVIFWEMDPHILYPPELPSTFGAGIAINGIVLYSSAHLLLTYFFISIASFVLLYTYASVKPINPTPRIILARRLMISASGLLFIVTLLLFSWPFPNTRQIATILLFFPLLFMTIVALLIPEAMLLSYFQIHRALDLYRNIQDISEKHIPSVFGFEKLVDYLKSIPPEILSLDE